MINPQFHVVSQAAVKSSVVTLQSIEQRHLLIWKAAFDKGRFRQRRLAEQKHKICQRMRLTFSCPGDKVLSSV